MFAIFTVFVMNSFSSHFYEGDHHNYNLMYGRAERSDLAKVMWQCNVLDRKGTDISGNHCKLCIPVSLAESKAQVAPAKAPGLFRNMSACLMCM